MHHFDVENHADMAVKASLEQLEALNELNKNLKKINYQLLI